MGGQLALFAATLNPSVGATVNFYGIHPSVKPDYSKLSGPVLGLFGAGGIPTTQPKSAPKELVLDSDTG